MSSPWPFEADVRDVVTQLAAGKYADLERRTDGVSLSAAELAAAVSSYGRRIIAPPDAPYFQLDVVPVRGAAPSAWSVDVDLWTAEEGRSDLTLQLTVRAMPNGRYSVEINDLHVL